MTRALKFSLFLLFTVSGCGHSDQQAAAVGQQDLSVEGSSLVDLGQAQVEGLHATVRWDEVERVFKRHQAAIYSCYELAVEEVEEIEGKIEFALQVSDNGEVVDIFVSESDLGSVEAEKCMLRTIAGFVFHVQGNGIAHFKKELTLEAPYDPPNTQIWTEQIVEDVIRNHQADVERCLNGSTGINLTLYVGRGGVVLSAGISTENPEIKDAGYCLAEACRRWNFPDPGFETAKIQRFF